MREDVTYDNLVFMNVKNILSTLLLFSLLFSSCSSSEDANEIHYVDWSGRDASDKPTTGMEKGESYLSVYSQIYSQNANRVTDLTVTVSIRNTNADQTIYLNEAQYFNTKGELIKSYFKNPIFVAPLETLEIVISQDDVEGGTGGNFYFKWEVPTTADEPLFESVMISTSGQQGISFITKGIRVK